MVVSCVIPREFRYVHHGVIAILITKRQKKIILKYVEHAAALRRFCSSYHVRVPPHPLFMPLVLVVTAEAKLMEVKLAVSSLASLLLLLLLHRVESSRSVRLRHSSRLFCY